MARCRENAGVLFNHACKNEAVGQCAGCHKPICQTHARNMNGRSMCVSCVRNMLKDRNQRGAHAWLRNDPHFYWYYDGSDWDDAYDSYDYALFDGGPDTGGYDMGGAEQAWEGS